MGEAFTFAHRFDVASASTVPLEEEGSNVLSGVPLEPFHRWLRTRLLQLTTHMNNWKLRSTITAKTAWTLRRSTATFQALTAARTALCKFNCTARHTYFLRTSASEDLGPVPNQVPGICNGTFTHTGAASGTVSGTVIDGQGTGSPTFTYTFLADGTLSTIVAATSGGDDKIRVGDKYQITTNEGHVIQFRLVNYSNARLITIRLIYNQGVLPFSVHRVRITESTDHTIQVLDYRSSQVFPKATGQAPRQVPRRGGGLRLAPMPGLGPAIKVRRDSDNATKDIGFSGGNLGTRPPCWPLRVLKPSRSTLLV